MRLISGAVARSRRPSADQPMAGAGREGFRTKLQAMPVAPEVAGPARELRLDLDEPEFAQGSLPPLQ